MQTVMREPVGCRLRTSVGGFLPVTTDLVNGKHRC